MSKKRLHKIELITRFSICEGVVRWRVFPKPSCKLIWQYSEAAGICKKEQNDSCACALPGYNFTGRILIRHNRSTHAKIPPQARPQIASRGTNKVLHQISNNMFYLHSTHFVHLNVSKIVWLLWPL